MPLLLVAMGLLGLAVGSFLNVVIHRVPAGESVVRPGSHCPGCDATIRTRHNVPVLGWLLLRGKCADCRTPISVRYPLVELISGLLFVVVTAQAATLHLLPALPALLVFTAAGVALTAIDLDVMKLPNKIVYPTLAAEFVLFGVASIITGEVQPLVRAVLAAAALGGLFFTIVFIAPKGMGLGDVKLAAVIGGLLGFVSYPAVFVGVFAAFLLAMVVGMVLMAARGAGRKTAIPFGPALIAGALLALFAAAPVTNFYASLTHVA